MHGLNVRDLVVRYGDFTAVDGVSLTVPRGQVVGLVGESGSGKSTLARAVVGLAPVHGGTIEIGGQDVTRLGRRQRVAVLRRVQMVFQDPRGALDPRFTVGQCVEEALDGSVRGADRGRRVADLLERVALDPAVARSRPTTLSGGQQQRVAIARALAADPEIILADEVTASLDVSVQAVVLNLLRDIQRSTGLTMLFISHNLAVVRYMADHVAVMRHGRLVEHGPTETLVTEPAEEYTRTLLGAVPRLGQPLVLDGTEQHGLSLPALPTDR